MVPCRDKDNSPHWQPTTLAEEYLEWDEDPSEEEEEEEEEEGYMGFSLYDDEAAAATDVASVGKTLVQLSTWTCESCEVNGTQAARFDVRFSVGPGRNARLDDATVTIRLEDKGLKVLELGPEEVQAKDPVKVNSSTESKVALEGKAGHAPVATAGPSVSRTSKISREGMVYPCRIKASVAGLSYARCAPERFPVHA